MDEKKRQAEEVESVDENEGEGSKSADRAYRRDVDEFLREEDPARLAKQARQAVEDDPDTYEKAEEEGKRRSAGDSERDADLI